MRHEVADLDVALFDSVLRTGWKYYALFFTLLAVFGWGVYAYSTQWVHGLGVSGLNRTVFWGFYITNFVYFIGISHAGTLVSAILRICNAEWRRPITRMAETITVMVLLFGAGNVVLDLGRPDRVLYVIRYPHITSPIIWDVICITTYLTTCTAYLYIPMIPDIALLRDRTRGWRRRFYGALALGWTGADRQQKRLRIAIGILAIAVIPIAVSVHTVISWIFAMTVQPMWHSTIFGPYFVTGAIYSGIAALLITMAVLRRAYHLQPYLKPIHFDFLGRLLLVMTLLWTYFTFGEMLTTYYGAEPHEMVIFWERIAGAYAPFFWAMVATNLVIPFALLCNRWTRTIAGTTIASISICVGMWLERFLIVVPTLVNPRLPWPHGFYVPTWVELALLASFFAGFGLFYMVFVKLFPIISIWEVREGRDHSVERVADRLRAYLPGESMGGA